MTENFSENRLMLILLAGALATGTVLFSFFKWRQAVKLAFVVVLLEGAIRKWALPQAQEYVYFLKDVLLFGAYARFFLFPDPDIRSRTVSAPLAAMVITFLILGLWTLHPNIGSPILGIYGLKNFFYYIPLIVVMPHLFKNEEDLMRQLSLYSLFVIPICLLGALQFFAPNASILNVYAHDAATNEAGGGALMGAKQFSRITGTFSYITGLVTFVQVFTAIALVCVVSGSKRYQWINGYINLPLLLAAGYMSGSRTAVFSQLFLIMTFVSAGSAVQLGRKSARALQLLLVLAVASGASLVIFKEAATAFYERAAYGADSTRERIIAPIHNILEAVQTGDGFGAGIGVTHPACQALRRFLGLREPDINPMFESEPAQIMAELGVIGFLAWYSLRLILISSSYSLFRRLRPGPAKPLCLCVVLLQLIHLLAQLVFNHTASFLIWGLYGAALTPTLALRLGARSHRPAAVRSSPNPAP